MLNQHHCRYSGGRRFITARRAAVVAGCSGCVVSGGSLELVGQAAGFFGGGALLLVSLLCFQSAWLRRRERGSIGGAGGWWPVARLGVRNATHRPGRSVLCITLIAFASFLIVAVDSFRRDDKNATFDKKSGTGGYSLMAESLLPLAHDPNTAEGREAFNLPGGEGGEAGALAVVAFTRFASSRRRRELPQFYSAGPRILARLTTSSVIRSPSRFSRGDHEEKEIPASAAKE